MLRTIDGKEDKENILPELKRKDVARDLYRTKTNTSHNHLLVLVKQRWSKL